MVEGRNVLLATIEMLASCSSMRGQLAVLVQGISIESLGPIESCCSSMYEFKRFLSIHRLGKRRSLIRPSAHSVAVQRSLRKAAIETG